MEQKKKRLSIWQWGFLLFLIVGSVWIIKGNRASMTPHETKGKIFGTYYLVKYESKDMLDSLILDELRKVDMSLSMFNKNSTLAHLNSNETDTVDAMFADVFHLAQQISKETAGAFDVTVAPLVNVWGFGFKNAGNVSSVQIDSIMQFVGYEKVRLEANRLTKKDPRMMMDFSAIAKGYGVDVVARMLDRKGVKNYMVEIGGEVIVKGKNPKQKSWTIGIVKPNENDTEMAQTQTLIKAENIAMATSGNYRRFYYKDGKRYAHTIDSHTGYPVEHSLLSATVLAPDCATADAYATAFMVMGLDQAQRFMQQHPELSVYFIYSDEKGELLTWSSPAMESYLKK